MLKYLALFVVIFGLAVYVSVQDERATQQSIQTSAQLANGTASAKAGEKQPQENLPDTGRFKRICFSFFRWPNGTTAWAIIFTLLAIAEQTQQTARAALATVKSANAMRDSIRLQEKAMELTVNTERPYLVISVESPSPNKFVFIAKNEGRTPARIKSIWSKPIPAVMGQPGPIPSDDETAESLISTPPQVLPTNGTCTVFYCDEHRLELMQASKFSSIYFYGRIVYFNTLETDPDKPYETKWLYCLIPGTAKGSIPFPDPRHPECNTWI
jgi:hypothetical protein